MQIKFAFIKSIVAKRIFLLFVMAAIIPVTITGIVSYNYVSKLLTDQIHKHLTIQSKSYGMAIFDRISVAESQLAGLSESLTSSKNIDNNKISQDIDSSNTPLFNKVKIYSSNLKFNNSDYKHLLDGNTKITLNITEDNNIVINFSRLLSILGATYILSADVDKTYIFGDMDMFAGEDDACVVTKSIGALNCSNNLLNKISLPIFNQYIQNQDETSTVEINDKTYIFASWELFLNGRYNTESWNIFYTLPSNIVFASIKSFGNILIPLLILAILVVTLISINQISRILIPLEKLSFLTKKIAKRDFSENIKFDSGDEFQQLGESFNAMSSELSRQFTVMIAMSNLDRAILSTMDIDKVVEAIFKNLQDYLEYSYASVVLLGNENNPDDYLYIYSKTDRNILSKISVNIEAEDINRLLDNSTSYVRTLDRSKLKTLKWLDGVHSNYITTIAIKQENNIVALIIVGHQFLPQLDEEGLQQLDNYTDRVNVALKAIEREKRLIRQANFDDLTNLPNRQNLIDVYNTLIDQDNDIQKIAVLFIDLDRFKIINDSQGHAIGDKLLIEAAERIQAYIDNIGFLARYGGDEFIILLPIEIDSSYISEIADNIIDQLSKKFTIENYEQYIGASIGISLYPQDGNKWDDVLQKADIAMFKAKQKGRSRYLFFSDTMQADILEKATLEADLFHAIEKQEVYMVYQPQINIATGEISGAETLMRWKHSTHGNIQPDKFIFYAEESGYIVPLGIWAMRTVLKQCEFWQSDNYPLPKISINISPKQLRHENFISEVESLVSDFDMNTTDIDFEITESLLLNDDINILDKLKRINELGISISIDDFGKGYSSLSYLKKLPVQALKIDKLFIDDIANDNDSVAIVKAIVAMAKSLGKTVIAEGVETVEQLDILKELGCDIAQGYFISKPKLAKDMAKDSKTAIISLEEFRANQINH